MYKILMGVPFPEDGTSRYRAYGPFNHLRKYGIELIAPPQQLKWFHLEGVDAVFLQRAFLPWQVQLAHAAKVAGIPVVTDYDDFLLGVTADNPTSDSYNAAQSKANVEACVRASDLVFVSTEALKKQLSQFNSKIEVVPNAIDFKIIQPFSEDLPRNPVVMWRGGHSHVRDVAHHEHAFMEAYERFPDYSFVFMGWNPWQITEKMNPMRVRYVPFNVEYINYMADMKKMRAAIHVVPLADNIFNRCKSRIAHLESTIAGSVCLAPAWEEWAGGHCEHYEGKNDFQSKLFELMSRTQEDLTAQANKSLSWVKENRSLESTNAQRVELFKKYLGANL